MKKFLLFALFAVIVTAISTLGGYEKSPPGDPAPYAYAVDNHDIVASATVVSMQSVATNADYFLPEAIIEEFQPISAPLITEHSERWCRQPLSIDKATKPSTSPRILFNPPKLC
jgi:hypothetical protein